MFKSLGQYIILITVADGQQQQITDVQDFKTIVFAVIFKSSCTAGLIVPHVRLWLTSYMYHILAFLAIL